MKRCFLSLLLLVVAEAVGAQAPPDAHASHHSIEKASALETHENMKAMRALMDKLDHTRDPAEREKLLAEHRQLMKKQMQAMQADDPGDRMRCREMMQDRMSMMNDLMDQMMRHEEVQEGPH